MQLSELNVSRPHLWSVRTPYLYTLRLTVLTEEGPQFGSSETANVTVGFRTLEWDHSQGLSVNGEHIKILKCLVKRVFGALSRRLWRRAWSFFGSGRK